MDHSSATQPLLGDDVEQATRQQDDEDLEDDIKEFEGLITKSLSNALKGSESLANMLPTGTVLFYQMLDPILFRAGSCHDKYLSIAFLAVCGLICFILSFTDSFHASNGNVYYGLATPRGLWTPQLKKKGKMDLSSYKIRPSDFVHAFLAVFAFFTTTSFSTDVISCFIQLPNDVQSSASTFSGLLISSIFLKFPTTRHGIGFPLHLPSTGSSAAANASAGSANGSAPSSNASAGSANGSAPASNASAGSANAPAGAAGAAPAKLPTSTGSSTVPASNTSSTDP